MNEKVTKLYYDSLLIYLCRIIDFKEYDKEINSQNLYINSSKRRLNNIGSDYYSLINNIYIDKLSDEQKNIILEKNYVDEELIQLVENTYFYILKKGNDEHVMYSPPMPNHSVKNGSLVLEFSYGKNKIELTDEEYLDLSRKQRLYIHKINNKLKNEVENKLKIPCEIFIEKRI